MAEVQRLSALEGAKINYAKIALAFEATKLLHGEDAALKAREAASALFTAGASGEGDAPLHTLSAIQVGDGLNVLEGLVLSGILESKAEGRRLLSQGGLTIDGEKILDLGYTIPRTALVSSDGVLIRKGKKHYYRLKISD